MLRCGKDGREQRDNSFNFHHLSHQSNWQTTPMVLPSWNILTWSLSQRRESYQTVLNPSEFFPRPSSIRMSVGGGSFIQANTNFTRTIASLLNILYRSAAWSANSPRMMFHCCCVFWCESNQDWRRHHVQFCCNPLLKKLRDPMRLSSSKVDVTYSCLDRGGLFGKQRYLVLSTSECKISTPSKMLGRVNGHKS